MLPVALLWYLRDNDFVIFWFLGVSALFVAISVMSTSVKQHGGVLLFCGAFLALMIAINYGL